MVHVDDVRVNALTHETVLTRRNGYAKQPNKKLTRSDGAKGRTGEIRRADSDDEGRRRV